MTEHDEVFTFSERTALADARTSSSTLILAGVILVRTATAPRHPFAYVMVGIALAASVFALWGAGKRYVFRAGHDDHQARTPWVAFAGAVSVICSSLAGLTLTFWDLPDVFDVKELTEVVRAIT